MPLPAVRRAGAVLALSLLLTACSTPAPTREADASPGGTAPGGADDADSAAQFGHVHALDLNPGDGRVYVATHYGLYFLEGGMAHRVGETRQDTMSFTVLSPDTFLASGHPGSGQEGPANLGLLHSEDAGRTWSEVSLGGTSDFHALTAAGDQLYGFDSVTGTVLRSSDGGTTWQKGAAIPARDLDVDPASPERLVATTAEGLMVSENAGATFQPLPTQPPKPLVVLDHLPTAAAEGVSALAGLDEAGVLWRFTDVGWTSAGPENGAPEAFTVVDEQTYLASFDTQVYRTDDGGRTWETISGAR